MKATINMLSRKINICNAHEDEFIVCGNKFHFEEYENLNFKFKSKAKEYALKEGTMSLKDYCFY